MRDLPDEEKEKTLTLKRDKSIAKDQKRLEEMKKKLHTDDESKYQNFNLEFSLNSSTVLLLLTFIIVSNKFRVRGTPF